MTRLYELIPPFYRVRDRALGFPLRALTEVLQSELDALEANVDALYDDAFIETCADWVVPYIGTLVGLGRVDAGDGGIATQRAHVANQILYRARHGTAEVLSRAASDVSGWSVVAYEFWRAIAATLDTTTPRPGQRGTIDLRDERALASLGTPFDTVAHTVCVRAPLAGAVAGPYDARDTFLPDLVGVFVWRLDAFPLERVRARSFGDGRATFDPTGVDVPLFVPPTRRDDVLVDDDGISADVAPRPLTREGLRACLADEQEPLPFRIARVGTDSAEIVPRDRIRVVDLSDWDTGTAAAAGPDLVLLDPELGRFVFGGPPVATPVDVDYAYGLSAPMGGGPYTRAAHLVHAGPGTWQAIVLADPPRDPAGRPPPHVFTDLDAALDAWSRVGREGLVQIADSSTYEIAARDWTLGHGLAIQAADGCRPALRGRLSFAAGAAPATVTLSGVLVDGEVALEPGVGLVAIDATIGPPRPDGGAAIVTDGIPASSWVTSGSDPEVRIERSITGPLRLAASTSLSITDSIVDGHEDLAIGPPRTQADAAGPATTLERVTVFGDVRASAPCTITDSIVTGTIHLPDGGVARERRASVGAALEAPRPAFTSTRYGSAAYAQLSLATPAPILEGGSDDEQLGAFHDVGQTRRLANLRELLREDLPEGLRAAIFAIT